MVKHSLIAGVSCCIVLFSLSCGGLSDDRYQGEVLFDWSGMVFNVSTVDEPGPVELVVAWDRSPTALRWEGSFEDLVLGTVLPVGDEFPTGFSLTLYEPPPDAVNIAEAAGFPECSTISIARLLAVRAGSTDDGRLTPEEVMGATGGGSFYFNYLVYLSADCPLILELLLSGHDGDPGYVVIDTLSSIPSRNQEHCFQSICDDCGITDPDACLSECDYFDGYDPDCVNSFGFRGYCNPITCGVPPPQGRVLDLSDGDVPLDFLLIDLVHSCSADDAVNCILGSR